MNAFLIHKPGPYSTLQDAGRPGLRRYGIPMSGAMDRYSFAVANLLVGNRSDLAAIEVTMQGLVLESLESTVVAITGGDLSPHLNDKPAPLWTALALRRGDRLSLRKRVSGCRAYVAVRGGFESEEFFGSKSTFLKGRMGALLKENDLLSIGDLPALPAPRVLPREFQPAISSQQTVRVILGPQADRFTPRGVDTFLQSPYSISPRSDRQGFRTEGPPIEFIGGPDIISDPTPAGAIQVPGDGKPIILHREGQVTGGYAKIGSVIGADMDKFGQMMAGDSLRFRAVTREEALSFADQARRHLEAVAAVLEGMASAGPGPAEGGIASKAPRARSHDKIWKPPRL